MGGIADRPAFADIADGLANGIGRLVWSSTTMPRSTWSLASVPRRASGRMPTAITTMSAS
jgi:hypothetical protein